MKFVRCAYTIQINQLQLSNFQYVIFLYSRSVYPILSGGRWYCLRGRELTSALFVERSSFDTEPDTAHS